MHRLLNVTDLVMACGAGFAVYKLAEMGPYELSLLLGRCLRVFVSALQGYI